MVGLGRGQDGCEQRIKVFMKIQKKIVVGGRVFFGGWGGFRFGGGGVGQGGCE